MFVRHTWRFTFSILSVKLPRVTENKPQHLVIPTGRRFGSQLAALTLGRFFINTGLRMVYPFLPAFSRGLGVSLVAVAPLVSLRGFAGLLSPLFSPLSERYGRRPVLAVSMLLLSLGCAVVFIWPAYWPFGLALSAIAVAKVVYDPAMQAYLGDVVPYQQRGKAVAVTELSWATAFLLGIPAIGFIMQRQGWSAPFAWLALFGIGAATVLWRALPGSAADGRSGQVTDLRTMMAVIRQQPVIWAAAVYIMLAMGANELLLIVYGSWMEDSFNLSLTALGLATSVIGAAESAGELLTGVAVDWIGKRPVVITTGLVTALMYFVISRTSMSLAAALVTLFVLFLFFEMTVVGGIPLMTELVPAARGVVMSVVIAAGSLGRASGALLGPVIWSDGGFQALGLAAAAIMLLAVLILAVWVREARSTVQQVEA